MSRSLSFIATVLGMLSAGVASGAVAFVTPEWDRPTTILQAGEDRTTYQHWDVFTTQVGATPDVASVNPNGVPIASDMNYPSSGTIVTSTGNLYAGSGIIRMNLVVPNYADGAERTRFLLQIKTIGSALFDEDGVWPTPPEETDFSRLTVNGLRVDSLESFDYERLSLAPGSGPTSFDVERAIAFDLPGNAAAYTIEWSTARGSCSQMEIALDTIVVVPEPVSAAALAAGLTAIRRRRKD